MARYKMREMPDLHGTGERKTYPHMVIERMIPLDELLERMSEETTFGAHELRAFARHGRMTPCVLQESCDCSPVTLQSQKEMS